MKMKYLKVALGKQMNINKFPSFSATGSIVGMKRDFYGKDAMLVKCGSYIYNVDRKFYESI